MYASNKVRVTCALLLSLLAVSGLWRVFRHEPSLLDQARRVAGPLPIPLRTDAYFWLNDNEFLYLTPMQKAGAYQVMRRNIATGAEVVQGDLQTGGLLVSPNGHWALTFKAAKRGSVWTIERTDSSRTLSYLSPGQDAPSLAWMPEDTALVELLSPFREGTKIHPGLLRTYSLGSAVPVTSETVEEDTPDLVLLGALPNHHVLAQATPAFNPAANHPGRSVDQVEMLDFPLERDSVARHFTIPRPPGTLNSETVLSPQGDRLAWLCYFYHEPPGYQKCKRLYDALHIRPSYAASLWLGKPDGSNLHPLGNIPIPYAAGLEGGGPGWPTMLRWTPDGKQVSLLYNNSLYVVPTH